MCSKIKINFGTLCIKHCMIDTDGSFCPFTFKLTFKLLMMKGGTLLSLGHGVKGQVPILRSVYDTDIVCSQNTFKLHM